MEDSWNRGNSPVIIPVLLGIVPSKPSSYWGTPFKRLKGTMDAQGAQVLLPQLLEAAQEATRVGATQQLGERSHPQDM